MYTPENDSDEKIIASLKREPAEELSIRMDNR